MEQDSLYLDKLDAKQRAASTVRRNSVVTAGAGAGKTTVLASRYIHLVVEKKIPVRSILALTFTRKAAAEMYERIYKALASIATPLAAEQLADFQNAHITTIDSFCAEIVRQAARDFGYSPEFAIDDEKAADLAKGIAYRFVARNREKAGVKEALLSFPFDAVASLLFGELGARRVTPLALSEPYFSPMRERLKAFAEERSAELLRQLLAASGRIVDLAAEAAAPRADCAGAIDCSRALIEAGAGPGSGGFALRDFAGIFGSFARLAMRSYGRNDTEQAIKELAKDAKEKAATLLEFIDYETMFPAHCALLKRLDEYASEVAEAKRLADVMDFKDLGACAVDVLKRRKDIRAFWKSGIESIMIDEFQDNNELQKNLLYLLAEKKGIESESIPQPDALEDGKLFFVGDEKQSIYRFRGADVAVFKRLSRELTASGEDGGVDSIALSANYRSSGNLIGFFNDFFAFVMEEAGEGDSEAGEDFHAIYSTMSAGSPSSQEAGFDSPVRYYLVETEGEEEADADEDAEDYEAERIADGPAPETLNADDSLAFEIAQFIKNSCGSMDLRSGLDEATGKPVSRKAGYSDFAVLLRTTTNQHRLEKYFRLLDIPFDSETPRGLFRESPANDTYNILRIAEDRDDKAAYAAVLRSPLCRVSDEAFLSLMTSDKGLFRAAEGTLCSEYDRLMLDRAGAFLESLRSLARTAPVSAIVEYVWNQGGLRLDILSRPESMPFLEHFDFIFHIAAQIDGMRGTLADFIARLRPYMEGEAEKYEIDNVPRDAVSGVKVLTIHKSKGLQFPVVILPWAENSGSAKRSQSLWHMLREGLTVDIKPFDRPGAKAGNIFFKLAKTAENGMNEAEIKRLLYVACTRAEDHLVFFGKKPQRGSPGATSFMYFLEGYLERQKTGEAGEASRLEKTVLPRRALDDVRRWYKDRPRPLAEDFSKAYARAGIPRRDYPRRDLSATELNLKSREFGPVYRVHGAETADFAETAPAARGENEIADLPPIPPDRFGDICHEAVEYAITNGSASGYVPSDRLGKELDPKSLAKSADLSKVMANRFLTSDFWRSLPPSADRRVEKPFILRLGEYLVEGRMDLFIETEKEVLVIDFKSDIVRDPRLYDVQLELYRRAASGIAPGKTLRVGLYWLRNGAVCWLGEGLPDEYLEELASYAAGQIGQSPSLAGIMPPGTDDEINGNETQRQ